MDKRMHEGTLYLKRVAALPYNPYFLESAKPFLQKYYGKHRTYLGDSIYKVKAPLKRDVNYLLARFGLPVQAFRIVMRYLLWGDDIHWTHYIDRDTGTLRIWDPFELYVTVRDDRERFSIKVTVSRVGPWTSKRQWDSIWNMKVKPRMEKYKDLYEHLTRIRLPGKKSAIFASCCEQMQRYSEWYQLSQIEGMGPKRALDEWERRNPSLMGVFELSTVTKAIKEFQEVITPVSPKK